MTYLNLGTIRSFKVCRIDKTFLLLGDIFHVIKNSFHVRNLNFRVSKMNL